MRTKNKMKDFEAESKEWWEVAKEYFTNEMKKNMVQHRTNEKILRYKLKAYKKNSRFYLWQSKKYTCISQDEKTKIGSNGIAQKEEVQTEEP
jgi:hypothetical protein